MTEPYCNIPGRNFAPNTIVWKPGEYVLHDFDAKRPEMLLRVVRHLPSGLVRAEYVDPEKRKNQLRRVKGRADDSGWFAPCDLHDPARFGVEVKR